MQVLTSNAHRHFSREQGLPCRLAWGYQLQLALSTCVLQRQLAQTKAACVLPGLGEDAPTS